MKNNHGNEMDQNLANPFLHKDFEKKSAFKYWVYDIKIYKRLLFLNKFPDQIEIGLGRDFTEFNKWYLNYFSNAIFSSVWNV